MARGEPLTVAIGGSAVVLPPELRESILALLAEQAGDGAGPGDRAGAGLPSLPLELPAELSVGQAADLLGVSRSTLAGMVDRGELRATAAGPRRRLATTDVLAARQRVTAGRTATLADVVDASRDLGLYPPAPTGPGSPPDGHAPTDGRPAADGRGPTGGRGGWG
jgi:excisionase family DNA binding protein